MFPRRLRGGVNRERVFRRRLAIVPRNDGYERQLKGLLDCRPIRHDRLTIPRLTAPGRPTATVRQSV